MIFGVRRLAAAFPVLFIAASAVAAPQFERRIDVKAIGPQRLDVDLALLAGSSSRFADLRIYDRGGREVPYLIVDPSGRAPDWIRTRRFVIVPTKTTSGIEADVGGRRTVDAVRIEGIKAPFLKRARIEGSGDRHRWTLLADTTVFDLPAEGLKRTEVMFPAAEVRYVRITWDDTSSARVDGVARVRLRIHGSASPPQPLFSKVDLHKRRSEPGRSRYRIHLPAAGLPVTAVELTIPRGDVHRHITVTEPRLGGSEIVPVTLGDGDLRQAERNGVVAAETKVPIAFPSSDELDLAIEDGANTPLQITGATLELTPQPWIYFEASAPGTYVARYGDPALRAPRYDLEAARRFIARSRMSPATWQSDGVVRSAAARPGALRLPPPGAVVDRAAFRIARPLAPASAGMSTLPLDADVVARSRELADIRIVDTANRQIPFIVEQRNEPLLVDIPISTRTAEESGISRYILRVPYQTLPSGARFVIRAQTSIFERSVRLSDQIDEARDPRLIASTVWRHADPDRDPPPLTINLPARIDDVVALRVDDGDNAPLAISSVRLVMPSYALRFIHPGTPLTLLYGNAVAAPPQYDLALIAPRLFREPAKEVAFAASDAATGEVKRGRRVFWVAIAAITLALLLLLSRVLGPAPQSGPP